MVFPQNRLPQSVKIAKSDWSGLEFEFEHLVRKDKAKAFVQLQFPLKVELVGVLQTHKVSDSN